METAPKKVIQGWAMYDWANSAYSLIITSAIFPAYYSAIVPEQVQIGGMHFQRAALVSYSIAFSFLCIAVLSPLLSSIADYLGNKKAFMRFFCYLGAASCMALFFFGKNAQGEINVGFGILCSVLASIGYCGSIVFYNAFLPEIATKEEGLCDYMFSVVIENGFYESYFTEKILDCFATGTIPVYLGSPNISKYFNEDGIIKLTEEFEVSEEIYNSKIDAIKDNLERAKQYEVLEDFIYLNYFKK